MVAKWAIALTLAMLVADVASELQPRRNLSSDSIQLENGTTAQIATLEEFLASAQSAKLEREEEPARPQEQRHSNKPEHKATANGSKEIPQHFQVRSLLNVSHDYPLAYSQVICGYVWPLMAALTLFTNLMIVFVLTQRDMRTPTTVVLTAIAIADIIPIVVPVPWFVYLFALGNEKQVLYPPLACYFYQHSTRSVSEIFYFLSTWLNVLLAVQDYLTAAWPRLARKYCQIRVVVIEIVALTLLAFLLNLPQALKLVFKPVRFYYQGQITWGCRALQAKWFKDLVGEYVALYDDIFTAIIVVFVDGGPAIALITLTALLVRQLQKQRVQGHLLMEQARTASKRRRERHRQQEYESSARVMIFVLIAFLAVKIPFATTYTLMIIQSRFDIRFVENLVDFQKAITLTDLVFVLSYPINFTIFCCCSKKFRHKCAQLLGECDANTRSAKGRLMASFSGSFASNSSFGRSKRESSVNSLVSTVANGNPPLGIGCDVHAGMAPDQLRRLAEEGSLCLECILRYEELRRRASLARQSDADSASWPVCPAPPEVKLEHYQHQLPHIVTTRCDSIREASNQSEGSTDSVGSNARARNYPASEGQSEAGGQTQANSPGGSLRELDASVATVAPAIRAPPPGQLQRPSQRYPFASTRLSSDPGPNLLGLGARKLSSLFRRSSDNPQGERRRLEACPSLSRSLTESRKSLTLSNSKLSTLPNATGLLADILTSTLLTVSGASEPTTSKHRRPH